MWTNAKIANVSPPHEDGDDYTGTHADYGDWEQELHDEVATYLEAVELFRLEGSPPTWKD